MGLGLVDTKKLRYFAQIADLGNMRRAAEALRVAQPALTTQISNLETELGVRLFERSHLGMRLTPAGDVLYRHARSILRHLEDARLAVMDEGRQLSGSVSVGIAGSTGKVLAVPLLKKAALHRGMLLEIVERPSAELLALVARGRLDIAIVVDARPCRGATITPMLIEDLFVIMPGAEAEGRSTVSLEFLARKPLILPSLPSTIRQRLDRLLMQARLDYRLVGEVSATDMLLRMVIGGLGWTVLPSAAVQAEVATGVVGALPLAAGYALNRELSLCVSDITPLSHVASAVRDMLRAIVDDLLQAGEWVGVSRV